MADIPRVLETIPLDGEWSLENRRARVEAILRDAEKLTSLYELALKEGKVNEARNLRKRAHQEARMAARLIGVLEIEFNIPMAPAVARTRALMQRIKGKEAIPVHGKI